MPLDLAVAGAGGGPVVLVVGGTHGDEFEGQMVALELVRSLDALTVNGRLMIMPFHHPPACRAGTRRSPHDDADLNRLYGEPGTEGPTARIARFVEERLLPGVDWVIDLHSGGEATEFVLSANLQARPGSAECDEMLPALLAFDAPYSIVFDEAGPHAMPHRGTLEMAARARGARALSSELGGGGRLTARSLSVSRQGLVNLLHHIGSVRSSLAMDWRESRSMLLSLTRPDEHLAAGADGWFCPARELGEEIATGDVIGHIVRDADVFVAPLAIRSATDGVLVALTASCRKRAEERVAYVASVLKRS
ncbi:MAG: succinylglutamate desuccinylase/aspartoacylase family protein [Novosphingobium sp.]|uniref:succinylglutamate desuccinylase/aspartoacylase domain-containing protein n=1 Tax=Novosphingobium sp. TaxID=1874826 RepID=UPI0022C50A40|nr:succinylglutamate desuccinylase/aspartoacylase family protein [Novosphingobium sp.]MCZ8036516.1 succinylglutamate desuccinylase/aspartoacylase family protein [Novosphingobium sp.]